MNRSHIEIEAIRELPNDWIDEKTKVVFTGDGIIYAVNQDYAPIVYNDSLGKWELAELANKKQATIPR